MPAQVHHPGLDRAEVLGAEVGERHAAVVLQRSHRRDDHRDVGSQAGLAALDVDELLRAEVRPEPRLGDHDVGQPQAGTGGHHRAAAVRDVRERAAVHERRRTLERLHQVRRERVAEQGRHRAGGAEVAGGHRLRRPRVADDDVADAALQVGPRLGEAEDRHQLRGDHDVEPVLAGEAVRVTAQADDHLAERAVVHVEHALPGDAPDVDVELVAVVHVVVDQRRQQVVRRRDRREVAGEVQVDVGHRHDLAVAATGRAALHAEDRSHRRLAQAGDRTAAQPVQRVGEADRRGRLALAGRGRRQRGHQHQPAERPVGERRQVGRVDLRLVVAVGHQVPLRDPEGLGGHLPDRAQRGGVGDLDVRQHCRPPSLRAPRVHVSPERVRARRSRHRHCPRCLDLPYGGIAEPGGSARPPVPDREGVPAEPVVGLADCVLVDPGRSGEWNSSTSLWDG